MLWKFCRFVAKQRVSVVFLSCQFNPLNAELNPICHLLALLGAHHILHVSRIRVNEDPALETIICKVVKLEILGNWFEPVYIYSNQSLYIYIFF